MKYFILSQKADLPNLVKPLVRADKAYERRQTVTKEEADGIKDVTIVPVISNRDNIYPGVIDLPVFLVSDDVKKMLALYDESLIFKCAVLTDKEQKKQAIYWLTLMDEVSCLAPSTEFHKAGSLKKLVLDTEKTFGRRIFWVGGIREKIVAVNLDIAESLLRRFLLGIQLTQIECI